VWGVESGVWGVGCGVWGVGCGVWGVGWRVTLLNGGGDQVAGLVDRERNAARLESDAQGVEQGAVNVGVIEGEEVKIEEGVTDRRKTRVVRH
jgi:hypothetical protein